MELRGSNAGIDIMPTRQDLRDMPDEKLLLEVNKSFEVVRGRVMSEKGIEIELDSIADGINSFGEQYDSERIQSGNGEDYVIPTAGNIEAAIISIKNDPSEFYRYEQLAERSRLANAMNEVFSRYGRVVFSDEFDFSGQDKGEL